MKNNELEWGPAGLLPAIVQDASTREVLMCAYMSPASLAATRASGYATFWSRSRGALWRKGETSGNLQRVLEIRFDCDGDALLLLVEPAGPACHTGAVSCFFRQLAAAGDAAIPAPARET